MAAEGCPGLLVPASCHLTKARRLECRMNPTRQLPESRTLAIAVTLATLLAFGLRAWDVTGQVVLDDEWHAIHKLTDASYRNIVRTFRLADHSIPLTLLSKAMADTIGLAEGRLRV